MFSCLILLYIAVLCFDNSTIVIRDQRVVIFINLFVYSQTHLSQICLSWMFHKLDKNAWFCSACYKCHTFSFCKLDFISQIFM